MVCVMGAYPCLNYIPVAALAGIMIVVVLHTFKWFSLRMMVTAVLPQSLRDKYGLHADVPGIEAAVIFIVTLLSNWPAGTNIAYAVSVGVAICSISYAWNSGMTFSVETSTDEEGTKFYDISGPLFFASANRFIKIMNPDNDPDNVIVRFSAGTSLMDYSAIELLQKIGVSYKAKDKKVTFQSLCPASQKLINKANHLVRSIEYTPAEEIKVEDVPDFVVDA